MATYRQALIEYLEADVALTALLTGGIRDSNDLPVEWLSGGNVDGIWNGLDMVPHCLLTWREENSMDSAFSADRQFVDGFVYANRGYTTINSAIARIKALFRPSLKFSSLDDATSIFVLYTQASDEMTSDDLYQKPMRRFRLQVDITLI
jgi:hypothetical protein